VFLALDDDSNLLGLGRPIPDAIILMGYWTLLYYLEIGGEKTCKNEGKGGIIGAPPIKLLTSL
jgi:hypothetical protein